MNVSMLSRRALGALAATSLLVGLLPAGASAATPTPRDITKFACPTSDVPDPEFSDDDDTTAEHRASIWCVVWYELAGGTTATTYSPGALVGRGAMAKFIANLLTAGGVQLPADPEDAFTDDETSDFELFINQLAELGVVEGTTETTYEPAARVTRAQMASFLNRAYQEITGAALTSSEDYFTDDEGAFHEKNINAVAGAGIAAGKTSSTYAPADPVKRDQMATFLARETDLLVEKGKIAKKRALPADVKLTSSSVQQGGRLTGSIDTQEGVQITSAKVSGCGLTDETLTLSGDSNAFEITIPVTQPVGDCTLTFTIDRVEGEDVVDTEAIKVTSGTRQTNAPELVGIQQLSDADDTDDFVTLRFTFDEPLANITPRAGAFHLYSSNADQFDADSAQRSSSSTSAVDAVFSQGEFDAATTATVEHAATEDQQGVANPEGAVPITQESRLLKGTEAPDLETVGSTNEPNVYWFVFDEEIMADTGGPENYHLVYANGEVVDGTLRQTEASENRAERKVTFAAPTSSNPGSVVRAYVDANTVSDAQQDGNSLNGFEGHTNPTQAHSFAATIASSDTPYLTGVTIDAANNQVIYTFNRSVTIVSKGALDDPSFIAYDTQGDEVGTNNATASGQKVTATFSGATDPITSATVGASVARNAVRAATGTGKVNEVDEKLAVATTTVSGNRGGETAAPDLQSVARSIDGNNSVLVFTFDQTVVKPTPAPGEDPRTFGDVVIYQVDGSRTELDLNDANGNECTTRENKIVCSADSTTTLGQAIDSAVLGAVEHQTVAASTDFRSARNYEASAPIQ